MTISARNTFPSSRKNMTSEWTARMHWTLKIRPTVNRHCVRMKDGKVLNRYYNWYDCLRKEMYRNKLETMDKQKISHPGLDTEKLFRDLRSGTESGGISQATTSGLHCNG